MYKLHWRERWAVTEVAATAAAATSCRFNTSNAVCNTQICASTPHKIIWKKKWKKYMFILNDLWEKFKKKRKKNKNNG